MTTKKLLSKKIEIYDLVPIEAQMKMSYMDGMQHNKPIQPEFFGGSRRKENGKGKFIDPARMSEESVSLVTNFGIGQTHIIDDDDDFIDLHDDVLHELKNKVLTMEMDAIKSQMSSLNVDQTKKMTEIIPMQGQLKRDTIEIMMNMQVLSEPVTAMISSSMDEILRRFNDRKGSHVNEFGDTEVDIVRGEESHVVGGFGKIDEVEKLEPVVDRKWKGKVDPINDIAFSCSLQSPSFDLGIGYTQPDDLHSAEI
ncbi:Hypothetical predicted protein [Olea europaea subsp. europaea]|uniref:Uncharacterized protein n=1 Tax=Olea europaea subsp. europaea TaxID=158383 RepID=A0A8S0T5A1_OLEEU|nr:Hypothetical predicted protein [Olea europaea subsp. europaea]